VSDESNSLTRIGHG